MSHRLTGLALLQHHAAASAAFMSKKDMVIDAGYYFEKDGNKKPSYTAYYEAVLYEKQYEERREIQRNDGGSKQVQLLIGAILAAKSWKYRNDSIIVSINGEHWQKIDVYFHGNLYCSMSSQSGKVVLLVNSQFPRSTKERINRILMRFCGCNLYQKKGKWYVYNPQVGDVSYEYGMEVSFI